LEVWVFCTGNGGLVGDKAAWRIFLASPRALQTDLLAWENMAVDKNDSASEMEETQVHTDGRAEILLLENREAIESSNAYVEKHGLPLAQRYNLADLIAEMPDGLPRVEGREDMPPVGLEIV
jgi:hypothetical protein